MRCLKRYVARRGLPCPHRPIAHLTNMRASSAQRRPGSRPRRHPTFIVGGLPLEQRSTKAGIETPATPYRLRMGRRSARTLNEGRDRDPGDTGIISLAMDEGMTAQRRPGSRPRRHGQEGCCGDDQGHALNEGRDRDPGDTGRSQLLRASCLRRSTKAGIETPATRHASRQDSLGTPSLNEGRDRDPGDTWRVTDYVAGTVHAQRRPGSRPRRHVEGSVGRGGGIMTAQRRPGSRPRRHILDRYSGGVLTLRSTKAGIETPATPGALVPTGRFSSRSTKAGIETPATHGIKPLTSERWSHAQRRPGSRPRRHAQLDVLVDLLGADAQRRPGSRPRRHDRGRDVLAIMGHAQRRPGSRPRRHAHPGRPCYPSR